MIFKIYGITDCPSCLRACADLMDCYPEKEYVFVDTGFSKKYRRMLQQKFKWPTFPIIVTVNAEGNEDLVGGYDDLLYVLGKELTEPV